MSPKRICTSNVVAKECIVEAVLQLTKEKPLSTISITELCKKAGVSRMTFYRNYDSIEDICIKRLTEIFEEYKEDDLNDSNTGIYCDHKHLLHYFEYIFKYRYFFDGLVRCGFDVIFIKMLSSYITDKWSFIADKYTLAAFSGSLYNMYHLWSDSHYTEDINTLVDALIKLYNT